MYIEIVNPSHHGHNTIISHTSYNIIHYIIVMSLAIVLYSETPTNVDDVFYALGSNT